MAAGMISRLRGAGTRRSAVLLTVVMMGRAAAQAEGGAVSGVVVDAVTGRPLAGAVVALGQTREPVGERIVPYLYSSNLPGGGVRTDSQGRFAFQNVDAGAYLLQAAHEGYGSPKFLTDDAVRLDTPFRVEAGKSLEDVRIRLVPSSEIRGQVTDAGGVPVPGAKVYLISKSRGLGTDSDETDPEGRYAFSHLFSDEYVVQVLAPPEAIVPAGTAYPLTSYAPGKAVKIDEGGRLEGIDIVIRPAAAQKVRGRIYSLGKLREARVEMRPLLEDSSEVVRHRSSQPEADGSFAFEQVPPGKYVVKAKGTEALWTMAGEREAAVSGETLIEVCPEGTGAVRVEVRPPIRLRGRVRLEEGVTLARKDVSVTFRGREMPWRVYGVSAKPGTAFDLTLPPDGSYEVSVVLGKGNHYLKSVRVGEGLQPATEVRLPAGAGEVEAELVVSPLGAQIEIGRPAGVSVYDLNAAVFVHGTHGEFERSLHALIDVDGGVRVHAVPPGHHRVLVWVGEDPPCAVDGAGGCAGLGEWITVTEAASLRIEHPPSQERGGESKSFGSGPASSKK